MWKLSFKDSSSLHSIQHNTQPSLKDSTDCINKEIQRLILQGLDNAFKERTRFVHPHSFLKILCILQASIISSFFMRNYYINPDSSIIPKRHLRQQTQATLVPRSKLPWDCVFELGVFVFYFWVWVSKKWVWLLRFVGQILLLLGQILLLLLWIRVFVGLCFGLV